MKLKTYNNRLAESVWWNLLWLTIGAFFVTVCVKSVVASHAMLAGGVLGMALLVFYNTGLLTPLIWYLLLSIPIWVWGWFFVGRRFLLYTAYGTICTTIFGMFVDFQIPINNEVYAAVVAGVLHGTGVGMMLRTLGSGGGTDIIAVALKQRWNIPIGQFSEGRGGQRGHPGQRALRRDPDPGQGRLFRRRQGDPAHRHQQRGPQASGEPGLHGGSQGPVRGGEHLLRVRRTILAPELMPYAART